MRQIRESKFSKIFVYYLVLMLVVETTAPTAAYALTAGPTQPEFSSFTPIGTSDMVDLASGDFNYNIPIMDVGGYPINLAYNSSVTMDQEASWVGLGWDMSVGQISRQVRGLPDDFNGDKMIYENNMRPNTTVGAGMNVFISPFGFAEEKSKFKLSVGLGLNYNNYNGFGISSQAGLSYQVANGLKLGMDLESSSTEGVSVSPSVSFSRTFKNTKGKDTQIGANLGIGLNSRKGLESMSMSFNASRSTLNNRFITGLSIGRSTTISFVNSDFTPTKRVGMSSKNIMFNLNLEAAIWGFDPGAKFTGFASTQGVKSSEKIKIEKAYGYEHTFNATQHDILDFNREKDRTVNKGTKSLPLTNHTYDLYSIQGQGVGGMFRPYASQVGSVFDNYTKDDGLGGTLGIELGAGAGTHWGFNATVTDSDSRTGLWKNSAYYRTLEKKSGNKLNYEKVFFKNIGGNHLDRDIENVFIKSLNGYDPISFKINGSKYSRGLDNKYYDKYLQTAINYDYSSPYIKRENNRVSRNQFIQKITREEASKFGSATYSPYINKLDQKNHTAGLRIIKDDGTYYNFERAAYNVVKKEVSFDVGTTPSVDCKNGLVHYGGNDNSIKNDREGDQYFNRITTPPYAHSYLLTSVLSSDYQDIDNTKGPSDGDLGTYTKFSYTNKTAENTYKWRMPYQKNKANFDEGTRSSKKDNKGNYLYGEKEMLYINKIETKTHIAIFKISPRKDGRGVIGENGGRDDVNESAKMWKLDKISLYSKPEYLANPETAVPIKEAHFVYDYSLCKGVLNNTNEIASGENEIENQGGKLTLKKVYFTYKNSNMGKYTPYVFNYDEKNSKSNPDYDQKAYDIWGNYKPANSNVGCGTTEGLSNTEFPYVDQNETLANEYSTAWLLRSIKMPSGGEMELNFESDDYKYVQNKEVMQMFKVVGAGKTALPSKDFSELDMSNKNPFNQLFYGPGGSQVNDYLYVKLDKKCTTPEFKEKYLKKLLDEPIYFRFLLNMTNPAVDEYDKYDYVTGYLELESDGHKVFNDQYAALKIRTVKRGDGLTSSNNQVNPISKAGWFFGRQYLNSTVYSLTGKEDVKDIKGVIYSILNLVPQLTTIFKSPNQQLIEKRIASNFMPGKSWIRLMQPEGKKFGGGSRVKELKIKDNWDVMTNHDGEEVYAQFYGQKYSYNQDEKGTTSGVATYEPLGSKENPLVQPFYDKNQKAALLGPDSENYVEKPFGESFFPSPKITYSKVTVQNLPRNIDLGQGEVKTVKKHATGKVVTEFFTSKDYPTITEMTKIDPRFDDSPLGTLLNINVKTHLTLAQGYSIHTNDMDGKMKNQWVYAEGQTTPISGMEYKYESEERKVANGRIDNKVPVIDSNGDIKQQIVGVDYDVINDFSENFSQTDTYGIKFNTAGLPLAFVFLIVPTPIPTYSKHQNILRRAITTKVIHSTGILRETVAHDVGSKVSTKNLAWDANTGEVIVTQTVNEYNDNYYNFNFPAYWAYKSMGQAATNLGLTSKIQNIAGTNNFRFILENASDYLIDGDEVWAYSNKNKKGFKAWIVDVADNKFKMIDKDGLIIKQEVFLDDTEATIKVIKSGFKNMVKTSMASVTLMKNPLTQIVNNKVVYKENIGTEPFSATTWNQSKIINTSAIEYNELWLAQCECNLPKMKLDSNNKLVLEYLLDSKDDIDLIAKRSYNPYRYNILGNWRPSKSYAYLTGRNNESQTPRISGFFNDYHPFYEYNNTAKKWVITTNHIKKWTFASEVTKYNPWGQEIENKDALKRSSTAIYGYNNKFPVAVASNAEYKEVATDGFEDYDFANCADNTHFGYQGMLKENKVFITNKQSHTGKRSLRIEPNMSTKITKKIMNCDQPAAKSTNGKLQKTTKK